MATRRKHLEKRAGFFAFSVLEKYFLKKSPEDAERIGGRLGLLFYRLSRKHRKRALSNLALAYPEIPEAERVELARKCCQHFGRTFADFLRSSARSAEEIMRECPLIGKEHLDEALRAGKGAILITGHIGNWERAAHSTAAQGYPLTVIVRDANDGDLNNAVSRIREMHGVGALSRGHAARGILTKLKANEIIAILPDQNSGDIFVPFFGKPCGTVTGPSSINLKTGAPLIPVFCLRTGPNRFEMRINPPIEAVEGYEPVEGMTRAINNALETAIRENPDQWLWFHDRWKSARKAGLL